MEALTTSAAANKRYLVGLPIGNPEIADILRGIPELKGRVVKSSAEELVYPRIETESFEKAFPKFKYRSAKETFTVQAKKLLELEKKLKK